MEMFVLLILYTAKSFRPYVAFSPEHSEAEAEHGLKQKCGGERTVSGMGGVL